MRDRHLFLVTDLEGAAGVHSWQQCSGRDLPALLDARRKLTVELNWFVDELFLAAARDGTRLTLTTWDGHGTGGVDFETVDSRCNVFPFDAAGGFPALLDQALASPYPVDGLVFVGQHAMEGSGGNLCHTFSSRRILERRLNGVPVGEFGVRALLAREYGVNVLCITGDDVACAEASAMFPGIVTAPVKRSTGITSACPLPTPAVERVIRDAARRTLELDAAGSPIEPGIDFSPPYTYVQRYKLKWGIVPKPRKKITGDSLASVLRALPA